MPTKLGPREEFIQNNLGLVHACAGRFRGRGIEYDDLYSAGCMGLVKAYDGFDEGRGVQFSTYAVPVILGEIKKLFRDGGTVKVSRSLKELGLKVNALRETAVKNTGAEQVLRGDVQRRSNCGDLFHGGHISEFHPVNNGLAHTCYGHEFVYRNPSLFGNRRNSISYCTGEIRVCAHKKTSLKNSENLRNCIDFLKSEEYNIIRPKK